MPDEFDPKSLVGQEIAGRYRLDAYIDHGGFGAVYRSTHKAYGLPLRQVAVKVSRERMTEAEASVRFKEAFALAQVLDATPDAALRDSFVMVYDAGLCPESGPAGGHAYVEMELVHGLSLARWLKRGAFPLKRARDYFDRILQAVAFMHTGVRDGFGEPLVVLHRDLKPGNILVVRRESGPDLLKVADFGLAVEVPTALSWAEAAGDLAYMAPECFSHEINTAQSDVYALGLLFYEMISGEQPFGNVGTHVSPGAEDRIEQLKRLQLEARRLERFPELERNVELARAPAVAEVIRRALTTDHATRPYRDAAELLAAWRAAWQGAAPPPRPEQPWERAARLTGEADQCFRGGDREQGWALLEQAMEAHSDARLTGEQVCGRTYLLMVTRLIEEGRAAEAGPIARQGHRRRKCRSTLLAMARHYAQTNPELGAMYEQEAAACEDGE